MSLLTPRRPTRTVHKGDVAIGSEHPVRVQSMTVGDIASGDPTLRELADCEDAGAEIMRVAVPNTRAADALPLVLERARVPIVADIHFNPRMALTALDRGAHCVRINPGNINDPALVAAIVDKARDLGRAMRIGVNSGSIVPRKGLEVTPGAIQTDLVEYMVAEALRWIEFAEGRRFTNFVVSIKSSNVPQTIAANRRLAAACDVPIHLGVTHAGLSASARRKSALAFGALLAEGIGDTLRVSITGSSPEEVRFGFEMLADLGMRRRRIEVIACPACGRAAVDVEAFTRKIEAALHDLGRPVTVSFLGCAVNGPGEAAEADFGVVAGAASSTVYRGSKPLFKVKNEDLVEKLIALIKAEVPVPAETSTR